MKQNLLLVATLIFGQNIFAQYHYPSTKTVDSSDTYFGTIVKDPYRWLENLNDSSVIKWFRAEADYTNNVMSKVRGQQTIINELEQFDKVKNAETYNEWIAGNGFIITKRLPGQQTSKYYYRSTPNGKDVLLFDPTAYQKGKVMDVNHLAVSVNGKYVLFQLSEQGKEGGSVKIMKVQTGKWLPDEIRNVGWFVGFMYNSSNEVIYQEGKNSDIRSKDARLNNKTMLHVLGTAQSADREIVSRDKYPELNYDSSDVAVLQTFYGCPYMFTQRQTSWGIYEMYYACLSELKNIKINWKLFCKASDEILDIAAHGRDVYCRTSKGNNHYRLMKLTLPNGNIETAQEIYAGDKDWKIKSFDVAKDYMLISLSKNDLVRKIISYNYASGKTEEIHSTLPGNTYISSYAPFTNKCQVFTLGWNVLYNFYEYNLESRKFSNGPIHVNFNYPGMNDLVAEEVEVPSYDGTPVPLSIVYNKKYIKKDGNNICLIRGYGAYGISPYIPAFGYEILPLLNRGVITVYAHVRGGGEKGSDWQLGGRKITKPNTWKDFNACADWLVTNGYTSKQKLGCEGASAGGILIGRAITERSDLYKVAISEVGLLNAIRSETAPGGTSQIPEYGTMKDSVEAKALIEMDALYHVNPNSQYPAQLITTGFNDPRVASWLPGKFAAAMQAANNTSTPTLLFVNYKGGHFGGSTVNEHFAELALKYAFLLWQCGHKDFQMN